MMLRTRQNTRGWSMAAALVSLVVMMVLGVTLLSATTQSLRQASRKHKESRALALAEAGVEHVLWRLYEETMEVPGSIVLNDFGGTATTSVTPYLDTAGQPVPDCVWISSMGHVQGWTTAVQVGARYIISIDEDNPIFGYALFCDRDLTLGGGVSFDHDIHTNGNLRINGGVDVGGNVEAGGNMSLKGGNSISGDINYGGTFDTTGGTTIGGDMVADCTLIPLPTIDCAYYREQAVITYNGSHNFAGRTTLPDGVIYVEGDVHLSGQVVGTGTIVVNGDVHITGSVTYGDEGSQLVILSTGQVTCAGGIDVWGFIYAHNLENQGGWEGTGDVTIHGSIIADNITSQGNLVLEYVPAVNIGPPDDPDQPPQIATFTWEKVT